MNDHLWVTSNIYFDNECCFCGRPYVSLIAHKDKNKVQYYLNVFKNNAEVNEKKRINELHKSAETFIREYEKYYRLYAS